MKDLVRSVDDAGSADLADLDGAALKWQLAAAIGSRAMELDRFLVCGLDSLGQHCVLSLQEFGVSAIAIDSRYRDATRTGGAANLGSPEFSRCLGIIHGSYKPQAERLVHALEKSQVTAQILPIAAMLDRAN